MRKPPKFWSDPDGGRSLNALLLAPLSGLYGAGASLRARFTRPEKLPKPVLCVGNISLGGVGKTPFTIALAHLLTGLGQAPHIVSRGYGGSQKGPVRVTGDHTADAVGDEPLLIARTAPVWVAANKADGGTEAIMAGADCILLDDGFQNPALAKDFSFVLIDASEGFGNGLTFPAGPLRERPETARDRAQCIVFVKPNQRFEVPAPLRRFAKDIPVLEAWLDPDFSQLDRSQRYYAFCGIGRPARFFSTLEDAGLTLVARQSFADHAAYGEDTLKQILERARAEDAIPLTTEKDLMRIPSALRDQFCTLPVVMRVDKPDLITTLLTPVLDVPRHKA